jgi:hypothetical protein
MQIALGCYREGQLLSLLEVLRIEFALLQEHRPTRIYSRAVNLLQSVYTKLRSETSGKFSARGRYFCLL